MSKSLLLTRPDHEIATKYLSVWSEEVVNLAKGKVMQVYDLKGQKATREKLESYMSSNNPSFIFINGHGSAETVTGYDDETIMDENTVPPESVIYARSCDAAQVLGPALVQKGIRAFIGYLRKFALFYHPAYILRPMADPMARRFLESSNLVASTLIKGHTVAEADNRAKKAMLRNFRQMISSAATLEERYAAPAMWSNLTVQVVLGDPGATI